MTAKTISNSKRFEKFLKCIIILILSFSNIETSSQVLTSSPKLVRIYKNEHVGFADSITKKTVIPCKFDQAQEFINNMVIVKKDNYYGIIDNKGKDVLKCEYQYIINVKELDNLYIVGKYTNINKRTDTKYGALDKYAKQILPFEYSNIKYKEGKILIICKNNYFGLANSKGEIIVPTVNSPEPYFLNGIACVKTNVNSIEKYGLVKNTGEIIAPFEYKAALQMVKTLAWVKTFQDKYYFYNTKGKIVGDSYFDDMKVIFNVRQDIYKAKKNGKWGFLNQYGLKIPCEYDESSNFENVVNGKVIVCKEKKYGMVDTTGKIIIPCEYGSVSEKLISGRAIVSKSGKYGMVDTTKKLIIPFEYNLILENWTLGLILVQKEKNYGLIDTTGKIIVPANFSNFPMGSEGIICLNDNKSISLVDMQGKKIATLENVQDITPFSNGLAIIKRNGLFGYINSKGEEVIPCIYSKADSFDKGTAEVTLGNEYTGKINTLGARVSANLLDSKEYVRNQKIISMFPYFYKAEYQYYIRLNAEPLLDTILKTETINRRIVRTYTVETKLFCFFEHVHYSGEKNIRDKIFENHRDMVLKSYSATLDNIKSFTLKEQYFGMKYKLTSKEGHKYIVFHFTKGNNSYLAGLGSTNKYPDEDVFDYFINSLHVY